MGPRENELVKLEQKYWQALKDRDVDAAKRLTSFPCIISGKQGVHTVDEKTFTSMMNDASYAITGYDLSDIQVRMLNDDVAVVAYKVHESMTVNGKATAFDAADSSTWIRTNGQWACAAHGESIMS